MAKAKQKAISAKWQRLFRLLPGGYCPVKTSTPGQYFHEEAADLACEFFPKYLTHIEGQFAGQPFALEEWQQAIIGAIFGWKRADGTRRYRTVFLGIPRGNGKTPLSAGLCIWTLLCDGEPGAQVYGAAADASQAGLLFRHAKGMIERKPALDNRCEIYIGSKAIVLKSDTNSVYKVVSSDAAGKHGYAPHAVFADELHAWQGRDLMEAFDSSFSKKGRRQPLFVMISTRDYDGRESVCNEKWLTAQRVRDGIVEDDSFLPILYEADDGDDWTSEAVWEKCNPNIDVSVDRDSLRRFVEAAKVTPTKESEFKRLHLNMRTESANPWLALQTWDQCKGDVSLADLAKGLEGATCYAGLDLSSTLDITAFALVFPHPEAFPGKTVVLPFFFVPDTNARQRERRDRVPYVTWASQGLIEMTDGDVVDYDRVRQRIGELRGKYDFRAIGADKWNATQICTQLQGDGFEVTFVPQSITQLNAPTKEFERLIISGDLVHGGNPVLRWMASNAVTKTDPSGNTRLDKDKSSEKIDGLAATVNAFAMLLANVGGASKYERQGLVSV